MTKMDLLIVTTISVPVGTVRCFTMTSQDKSKKAGRPTDPTLRDHLLNHAMNVLLAKGLSGFSMINVAKSAKASKETLYKHFGDKQGLLHAAIERDAGFIDMVLTDQVDSFDNTEDRLKQMAKNYLSSAYTEHGLALQRLAYADGDHGLGPLFVNKITSRVINCVAAEFTRIHRADAVEDAELFLGLVQGKMYNKIVFGVVPKDLETAITAQIDKAWNVFTLYLNHSD
ncbi:MAG: TetR/AcrR family transcriptional regulator [Pseudomonadales bacterium]|nr:TetR/AcrR family transcriptional regulator [Pseudomonadales bacterium]